MIGTLVRIDKNFSNLDTRLESFERTQDQATCKSTIVCRSQIYDLMLLELESLNFKLDTLVKESQTRALARSTTTSHNVTTAAFFAIDKTRSQGI